MTNEFWAFSLATYAIDGVAENLLAVQDTLDLDVNVLLYATWLASCDLKMTEPHLAALEGCIGQWRQRVVLPLRVLRRALRDYPDASAVREAIKALELQSERQQQDMMWDFFTAQGALPSQSRPLQGNLNLLVGPDNTGDASWIGLQDCLAGMIGG